MPSRGSFPYVVLTSAITLAMASFLWAFIDYELVRRFTETNIWQDGIASAMLARHWILLGWNAFLPVVLLGVGTQLLISARLNTASTGLIKRTFFLWVFNVFLIIWGLVFGKLLSETFRITSEHDTVNNALLSTDIMPAVTFLRDIAFGYGPSLLMAAAGLYYFWAPIRDDLLPQTGVA